MAAMEWSGASSILVSIRSGPFLAAKVCFASLDEAARSSVKIE
jgi:hypothetical protein